MYLEQLILKHGAHKRCTNIKSQPDGLDFFFGQRNDAVTFVSFLDSVMAIRSKTSEQLISRDIHAGTATYKFTFSVEIVPLCRDDLVAVPKALNSRVFGGGMSPFCLVKRMGHSIHMYDPWKLYFVEIPGTSYWHTPFKGIAQVTDLVPFLVLNVEETGHVVDKYVMADIEITRESDMSKTWIVRSHLGRLLKVGDIALGYDLKGSFGAARMDTVTFEEDSGWQQKVDTLMDEILLVKKQHVKKGGGRKWKLKHLSKKEAGEEDDDLMVTGDDEMQMDSKLTSKSTASKKASKSAAKKRRTNNSTTAGEDASVARDLEIFMQDLEGDAELRKGVLLYRENSNMFEGLQNQDKEKEYYSDSDGASSIDLAELLDDLSLTGSSSDEGYE